jgi:hypothetical protein
MNYNKMPSPATLEDMSLGTSNLAPAMVAPKSQQVTLADVYALDIRTIINYLVNFGIFYFDLDAMIFSPADSDMVMALKQTALQAGVDVAGAWVRTQYPNMVI